MTSTAAIHADLILIGAGYAGVCAFEAAAHHLPRGARVVIIDRNKAWGGMWNTVYHYVRLHQPYKNFTAGAREWSIGSSKPEKHLASKGEILNHFSDITLAAIQEQELDVCFLFSHEIDDPAKFQVVDHDTEGKPVVQVVARPVGAAPSQAAPLVTVTGNRMINATGFDVPRKVAFDLSTNNTRIHSLTPADVLTGSFTSLAHFSTNAEIIVIGSGKTAMDVLYHIAKREPNLAPRLRCIAGRGTWFLNRKATFPTGTWEKYVPSTRTSTDIFFDILEKFDGTNEQEVYRAMERKEAMHSVMPQKSSFVLGVTSEEEMDIVRQVLTPTNERITHGYLVDIVDHGVHGDGGTDEMASTSSGTSFTTAMRLRDLEGNEYLRNVSDGTIVINATDNLVESSNRFMPVIDSSGLVLSPQALCGFSGPSATLATHAWFAGTLSRVWKHLPRLQIDVDKKSLFGLHLMAVLVLNTGAVRSCIPKKWLKEWIDNKYAPNNRYPMYRLLFTGLRAQRIVPVLFPKFAKMIPARYTDKEPYQVKQRNVLGGNAMGKKNSPLSKM